MRLLWSFVLVYTPDFNFYELSLHTALYCLSFEAFASVLMEVKSDADGTSPTH